MVTLVSTLISVLLINVFAIGGMNFSFWIIKTLIDANFASFDSLNTFIPELLGANITEIMIDVSFILLAIVTVISVIRSIVAPTNGQEAENPTNIIVKALCAVIAIAIYPTIINFVIDTLNQIVSTPFFATNLTETSVNLGNYLKLITGNWDLSAIFGWEILANIVLIVALVTVCLGAAFSYVERYLSFALFIGLGPICFAFFPEKNTENMLKEWFMGVISQALAILMCLFVLNLAAKQFDLLVSGTNPVTDMSRVLQFVVLIALMTFVKNSEEFVTMLGFRTMPNRQTANAFFGAMMGTFGGLATLSRSLRPGIASHMSRSSSGSSPSAVDNSERNLRNRYGNDFINSNKDKSMAMNNRDAKQFKRDSISDRQASAFASNNINNNSSKGNLFANESAIRKNLNNEMKSLTGKKMSDSEFNEFKDKVNQLQDSRDNYQNMMVSKVKGASSNGSLVDNPNYVGLNNQKLSGDMMKDVLFDHNSKGITDISDSTNIVSLSHGDEQFNASTHELTRYDRFKDQSENVSSLVVKVPENCDSVRTLVDEVKSDFSSSYVAGENGILYSVNELPQNANVEPNIAISNGYQELGNGFVTIDYHVNKEQGLYNPEELSNKSTFTQSDEEMSDQEVSQFFGGNGDEDPNTFFENDEESNSNKEKQEKVEEKDNEKQREDK